MAGTGTTPIDVKHAVETKRRILLRSQILWLALTTKKRADLATSILVADQSIDDQRSSRSVTLAMLAVRLTTWCRASDHDSAIP